MKKYSLLISFLTLIFLTISCADAYHFSIEKPKKVILNESITVKLIEKNDKPIDKVKFYLNGKEISSN